MGRVSLAVIVPARNAEATIQRALQSVLTAVAEVAGAMLDLVVVDGQSTDRSRERAQAVPGVRILQQDSLGLAEARNAGIRATTAPLLGFCDADDTWSRSALIDRLAVLGRKPEAWGVSGRVRFVDVPGALPAEAKPLRRAGDVHTGDTPGALLLRRAALTRIGGFDSAFRIAADADWLLRASDLLGPAEETDRIVLEKGLRAGSLSTDRTTYRAELLTIARRRVQRRRQRPDGVASTP